jgi:hypothetical protein
VSLRLVFIVRAVRAVAGLASVATAVGAGAQVRPRPITPRPPVADTSRAVRPPVDTTRAAPAPAVRDTSRRAGGPRQRAAGATPRPGLTPPVSPKRALISSLLLPGLGQTRLLRPTAGAIFAGVELASLAMISKSRADLRTARALRADSISTVIALDTLGRPTRAQTRVVGNLTDDLVRARGLHVEDWVAVLLFNHLISGAEAFVSAQLYDLPAQISARPSRGGGTTVAVSVAW